MTTPSEHTAASLLAIAHGDRERAIGLATEAAIADPTSRLAPALTHFLETDHDGEVYTEPDGFEDFIDNGGNPALYAAAIERLSAAHRRYRPRSYLDVGCGDGRVTAAVHHDAELVGLVEPSTALLTAAQQRLTDADITTTSFNASIEHVLATSDDEWDLVQATFAMHTLEPMKRATVVRQLADRTQRLLLVEFDIPDVEDRSPAHAAHAVAAYERGLAEYDDWPTVQQRFLMPVLVGQFDPKQPRHTHEQSGEAWQRELLDNGWDDVQVSPIVDYWWAPALLVDARVDEVSASTTGANSSGERTT